MVITEEIIAAYIEGKVSADERKEVRHYLVEHPEIQDLVFALMDEEVSEQEDVEAKSISLYSEQSFSDIAYAAAAFAPKLSIEPQATQESIENHISQRQKRMSAFWNELQQEE